MKTGRHTSTDPLPSGGGFSTPSRALPEELVPPCSIPVERCSERVEETVALLDVAIPDALWDALRPLVAAGRDGVDGESALVGR